MFYRKKEHMIYKPSDLGDINFQIFIWSLYLLLIVIFALVVFYSLLYIIYFLKIIVSIYETLRVTFCILK
jgi:hypothetical protein